MLRLFFVGGGANLGYGYTSVLFVGIIFILTTYMTSSKFDQLGPSNEYQSDVPSNIVDIEVRKREIDDDDNDNPNSRKNLVEYNL